MDKKICLIGNLNIDVIIRNFERIPDWGEEVIGSSYNICSSGQAFYTCMALAKLGIKADLVSVLGDDDFAKMILGDLEKNNIWTDGIKTVANIKTGISVAAVNKGSGDRLFFSDPSSLRYFDRKILYDNWDRICESEIVFLMGILFIPGLSLDDILVFIKELKKSGKTVGLDTGWDPDNWKKETVEKIREIIKYIDIFIPNSDEAEALSGEKNITDAAVLLKKYCPGTLVIKLGSMGSIALDRELYSASPFETNVVDTVGAGDVFNAGFIYGMLKDWPLEKSLIFGNALSSIYISRDSNRFPVIKEALSRAGIQAENNNGEKT